MPHRVEIVCHRGANEVAPENTFASAQRCIEWGMDYIEVDVSRSVDGVHYLFHGPRLEKTTNGVGLIGETHSSVVDSLDAGSWFSPQFAGERVPRLDEFLRWIKGKAKVYLDIKDANLAEVMHLLDVHGLIHECFLWSSHEEVLREARRLAPEIALMVGAADVAGVVRADEEFGAAIVEVLLKDLTQAIMQECRKRGLRVMVLHGHKDPEAFRQILRWGVDLVNIDHGDLFLRVRQEYEAQLEKESRAIFQRKKRM